MDKATSRLPFKCNFRNGCIRIGSVVNGLDYEFYPFRFDRAKIGLLALQAICESEFTRAAIGKVSGDSRQSIVLGPNRRTLEIARLKQNSMNDYLPIKIEANPFADASSISSFDPCRAALAVDRVGRVIAVCGFEETGTSRSSDELFVGLVLAVAGEDELTLGLLLRVTAVASLPPDCFSRKTAAMPTSASSSTAMVITPTVKSAFPCRRSTLTSPPLLKLDGMVIPGDLSVGSPRGVIISVGGASES